jgi:hypothetical protein
MDVFKFGIGKWRGFLQQLDRRARRTNASAHRETVDFGSTQDRRNFLTAEIAQLLG